MKRWDVLWLIRLQTGSRKLVIILTRERPISSIIMSIHAMHIIYRRTAWCIMVRKRRPSWAWWGRECIDLLQLRPWRFYLVDVLRECVARAGKAKQIEAPGRRLVISLSIVRIAFDATKIRRMKRVLLIHRLG